MHGLFLSFCHGLKSVYMFGRCIRCWLVRVRFRQDTLPGWAPPSAAIKRKVLAKIANEPAHQPLRTCSASKPRNPLLAATWEVQTTWRGEARSTGKRTPQVNHAPFPKHAQPRR
jgi:hypothetical protein